METEDGDNKKKVQLWTIFSTLNAGTAQSVPYQISTFKKVLFQMKVLGLTVFETQWFAAPHTCDCPSSCDFFHCLVVRYQLLGKFHADSEKPDS